MVDAGMEGAKEALEGEGNESESIEVVVGSGGGGEVSVRCAGGGERRLEKRKTGEVVVESEYNRGRAERM